MNIIELGKQNRWLLLAVAACFLVSACCGVFSINTPSPSDTVPAAAECQTIQHDLGETCVPNNPQRLVATDGIALEVLLALDRKPLAAAEPNRVSSRARHLKGKTEGVDSLGKESSPSLEKLVQLNPDMILGFNVSSENYELFSQVAPTVSFEYTQIGWKDELLRSGEAIGNRQRAEQLLAEYQARIQDFQTAMGERLEQTEVSVVRFYTEASNTEFRPKFSFPGSVLEDMGLPRPAAQSGPEEFFVKVSLEQLERLDGDVIFAALDPGAEKSFETFQSNPLWQNLEAVKNDRVYIVDSGYWIFGNILAANAILEDLFNYLLPAVDSGHG
ncbi:iron-siderophore ABC transporter substrate-binding protein [Leptothoe sp. LEGE 181152]|nr:iron-siderophore ABC transporter substrate-binding protein [Leptothoe sp. LEGE 181152]